MLGAELAGARDALCSARETDVATAAVHTTAINTPIRNLFDLISRVCSLAGLSDWMLTMNQVFPDQDGSPRERGKGDAANEALHAHTEAGPR